MDKRTLAKLAAAAIIAAAALLILMAAAWQVPPRQEPAPQPPAVEQNKTPPEEPAAPTKNETIEPEKNDTPVLDPFCNHDKYCDENENATACYEDCGPVFFKKDVYSNRTFTNTTAPTIAFDVSDAKGVKSCGVGETDSTKWNCTVKTPGAAKTKVSCTLQNYFYDGTYMLPLRCKAGDGSSIPPIIIDNILVCASTAGCMR
jgi:hypothetical protein